MLSFKMRWGVLAMIVAIMAVLAVHVVENIKPLSAQDSSKAAAVTPEVAARSAPPRQVQSRFNFKTKDGNLAISIYQTGVNFTLEDGVALVEYDKTSLAVSTAPGGILLIEQDDTLIECANFARLKKNGNDILHVTVSGGGSPLASARGGNGASPVSIPLPTAIQPTGPSKVPATLPPRKIPEKVKIVD